jgi:hypothetical protein
MPMKSLSPRSETHPLIQSRLSNQDNVTEQQSLTFVSECAKIMSLGPVSRSLAVSIVRFCCVQSLIILFILYRKAG